MGISCCIKKTVLTNVLKRKRIAKQNAIFSLEVRSRLEIQRALVLISTVSCSLNFHWTVFCLAARTWSCSTAWRHKNRSSTGSWPRFIHCSLLQRSFPFDFLFLSDIWIECVLLISCLESCGNHAWLGTHVSVPATVGTGQLNGFDDSRMLRL